MSAQKDESSSNSNLHQPIGEKSNNKQFVLSELERVKKGGSLKS